MPERRELDPKEIVRPEAIAHNLEIMSGPMIQESHQESSGGNAGVVQFEDRSFQCTAVNGKVNAQTGRIETFGNSQDLPDIPEATLITIRIGSRMERGNDSLTLETKIIDASFEGKISKDARQTVQSSIDQWNEQNSQPQTITRKSKDR